MRMSRGNDSALIVPSYEACFSPRAAQAACANGACCSCPGALSFAAGEILVPLYIIDAACLFSSCIEGTYWCPWQGQGKRGCSGVEGRSPRKKFCPDGAFLLTLQITSEEVEKSI